MPDSDGERLNIELGRALRIGENKCKLYYINLREINDETEKIPYLCDWIICNGATVEQTKRDILAHISKIDPKYDILPENCKIRRKTIKNPGQPLTDEQIFGDEISVISSSEVNSSTIDGASFVTTRLHHFRICICSS